MSELVGTSSDKYTFLVRRARPQQHQSNGGAERAVRRLKESLAVLRAEMSQGGAMSLLLNVNCRMLQHTLH